MHILKLLEQNNKRLRDDAATSHFLASSPSCASSVIQSPASETNATIHFLDSLPNSLVISCKTMNQAVVMIKCVQRVCDPSSPSLTSISHFILVSAAPFSQVSMHQSSSPFFKQSHLMILRSDARLQLLCRDRGLTGDRERSEWQKKGRSDPSFTLLPLLQ